MRSFWSHGLAFILGGFMTFLIFATIANVEANRRNAELRAEAKAAQAQANAARVVAYSFADNRLKVLVPK